MATTLLLFLIKEQKIYIFFSIILFIFWFLNKKINSSFLFFSLKLNSEYQRVRPGFIVTHEHVDVVDSALVKYVEREEEQASLSRRFTAT